MSHHVSDLFTWRPERLYDAVFFGFWLSHVPLERLNTFLTGGPACCVQAARSSLSIAGANQPARLPITSYQSRVIR